MVKGLYHYIKKIWQSPDREMMRDRLIQWRAGNSIEKVDKPSRIDKARALGYKAKKGFVVYRVRVRRGGRKRPRAGVKGRKTRKQTIRKVLKMNYRWVAEVRAARKFKNLTVLNSYPVGQDGKYYFFEVIMVDSSKPEIKNDPKMRWMANGKNKKRAERGLTSAGKKSRGFKGKKGLSPKKKIRKSVRSSNRIGK